MAAHNPYLELAAAALGGLAPYEPGKPVEALEREYGVRNAVKLASNENPAGPSPAARTAAMAALAGIERYPDSACFALRDTLARHLRVRPEQITLGNGSNDVLVLLAEAFLTQAHSAVYDQYSFVVYRLAVQACGAQALVAAANPVDHAQPLGHDLSAMLALVQADTRLVFIANPNNPTGTWVEQAELRAFLQALPEHVIAVLDEAYLEYARQPDDDDALTWLAEFPRLVVVRTFSKAYGLAGLRVGYSVSAPGIADLLNRVRQPFNVNAVAQQAAIAALDDQAWLMQGLADNAMVMEQLRHGLQELGLQFVDSRGNFLLVGFGSAQRAAACNEHLLREGIIVRPVGNYGLADYLRVTVGTAAEVDRLLHALQVFSGGSHG